MQANVSWANMVNKAGKKVAPSVASVQSAMNDFQAAFAGGNFSVDILDAAGNASWPMAYMTFFALLKNVSVFDCTDIQEMLNFVAWVQTNDQYSPTPSPLHRAPLLRGPSKLSLPRRASTAATNLNVVPLALGLHKRIIDLLGTVQCNGEQAFSVPYLVGAGSPITVVRTWTSAWSSATTAVEYYQASSNQAKQQLVTYNEDFGIISTGLSADWYAQMEDAVLLPLTVYAATPGTSAHEIRMALLQAHARSSPSCSIQRPGAD